LGIGRECGRVGGLESLSVGEGENGSFGGVRDARCGVWAASGVSLRVRKDIGCGVMGFGI